MPIGTTAISGSIACGWHLLVRKTGWTEAEITGRVGLRQAYGPGCAADPGPVLRAAACLPAAPSLVPPS